MCQTCHAKIKQTAAKIAEKMAAYAKYLCVHGCLTVDCTNPVCLASLALEQAQTELEAARDYVHYSEHHGREIGLAFLSISQQRWDRASVHYDTIVRA